MHVFTSPLAQSNSIRPSNVALIMDWRHLSGHNIPQASVPVNTPTTGKEVSPPHKLERDTPNIHPQGAPEPAQANADAEAEAEAAARAKGSINGMHQGGSTHQDEQFLRPPIVWAEQLCVRREMKEGFQLGSNWKTDERAEDGPILPTSRRQRRNSAPSAVGRPIAYEEIPMVEVGK
ncbi:hypothetical protein EMMF5_005305 [Cystobasidiomycetes sp. EMM_F5]